MGTTGAAVVLLLAGLLSVVAIIWGIVRGAAALKKFRRERDALLNEMEAYKQAIRKEP